MASSETMTKRDRIVEDLRRRILSNDYPRGARLRQDELAHELCTSITPVREALRVLEAEGLVVSRPHKGVRVAGLDIEKTKATYIVRRLVESYAMRRATLRVSALDINQAWSLIEDMAITLDSSDPEKFRHLNHDFHFLFYERCGLPALSDKIAAMWRAFPWDLSLRSIERDRQSYLEHIDILKAVESRDTERVAAAAERHQVRAFLALLETTSPEHVTDPFDIDSI